MFAFRKKHKNEKNDLLQSLLKVVMISLYGVQIRKDVNNSYCCNSEKRMKAECDENGSDYWNIQNGNYIVKMKKDDGLDNDCDIKNTLPGHLEAFI